MSAALNVIYTPSAPAAIGPYSQAIAVNGLVYTSGQIAIDPATGSIDAKTIEAQTERLALFDGERHVVNRLERLCADHAGVDVEVFLEVLDLDQRLLLSHGHHRLPIRFRRFQRRV